MIGTGVTRDVFEVFTWDPVHPGCISLPRHFILVKSVLNSSSKAAMETQLAQNVQLMLADGSPNV